MSPISTNLHFHGLTIPPTCHQDDVMKTSVQPGDPPFGDIVFGFRTMSRKDFIGTIRTFTDFPSSSYSGEHPAH